MAAVSRAVLLGAVVLCLAASVSAVSVMSVDLGLEWFKVGLVKPGVPMEIVLNFQSKRKTPAVVSVYNGERLVGDPARAVAVKQPKASFAYLQMLLGQRADSPVVSLYREWFPHYDIVAHETRGTVVFKAPDGSSYSVEELVAMIFDDARKQAEAYGGERIGAAVITVPPFFAQAERRAVLDAAALAGLSVLQLQSDNAAVALNYGVFRRAEFNATAQHILFYDMGAGSTTATLVAYYTGKVKEGKRTETHPIAEVLAVGYDRTLGGLQMEFRLRDHLAALFMKQKGVKNDVRKNARAMIKLSKEAKRVKEVLSANTETFAQIESLADDIDFKAKVTRVEFEEMCADLFARAGAPLEQALRASDVPLSSISQVILFGGGPRIPKVQAILQQVTERTDLSKNINSDEAAALGAAFQAAALSKAFKVKNFVVKDATLFPITVSFERGAQTEEDGTESAAKTVTRALIHRHNAFPQKKVMTFARQSGDFDISVEYGDLEFLSESQRALFGSKAITKVRLEGLGDAIAKHEKDDAKGVKVHFNLDHSGILSVDSAEAVYERPADVIAAEEAEAAAKKSTFERLGDTLSSFFGSSEKGEAAADGDAATEDEAPAGEQAGEQPTGESSGEGEKAEDAGKAEGARDESPKEDAPREESAGEETPESENAREGSSGESGAEGASDEGKEKGSGEENAGSAGDGAEEAAKQEDGAKGDTADKEPKAEEKKEEKKDEKKDDKKEEKKEEKKEPPKPRVMKERLRIVADRLDLPATSDDEMRAGRGRLEEMNRREEERREVERAKNELEAFAYATRDKLTDADYERVSTAEERESLLALVDEATAWLYDATDAGASEYRSRLSKIRTPWDAIAFRHDEIKNRPRFTQDFRDMCNMTRSFLVSARNISAEERGQTDDDLDYVEKLIVESEKWLEEKQGEQDKLQPHENPVLTTRDIGMRVKRIERELTSIVRKPKPKPKPKPAPAKNATADASKEGEKKEEEPAKSEEEARAEKAADESAREGDDAAKQDEPKDAPESEGEARDETKEEKKEEKKEEGKAESEKEKESKKDKDDKKKEGGDGSSKSGKRRAKRKTAEAQADGEPLQLDDGSKDEL